MNQRCPGYCRNCHANVLHVRVFEQRLTYVLDRLSLSCLAWFGLGPWQCVDCGRRSLRVHKEEASRQSVGEQQETVDSATAIGNVLRTEHSLAHAATDRDRFSQKFRSGTVEKLLEGQSTVTRCCRELNVSELEIQRWIRDYLQRQLDQATVPGNHLVPAKYAGFQADEPLDWDSPDTSGPVIESTAVRKPR